MKTKLLQLKSYLKELAERIKSTKIKCKEYQKSHCGSDCGLFFDIWNLKREYRHHHIAYCTIRGTDRDKIEKPAEDNLPDETYIQGLINDYTEIPEDVRACA